MKRPDAPEAVTAVRFTRHGPWHGTVETCPIGVRVVVEGATHWYRWDRVRAARAAA